MGASENEHRRPFDADQALSGLIDRARLGSVGSQNNLFGDLRQYLLAIANEQFDHRLQGKLGPSDIVQQSMIRAVENFGDYRGQSEAEFRGWLRQIVINEARLAQRGFAAGKRDARREHPLQAEDPGEIFCDPTDRNLTPPAQILAAEQSEVIKQLIEKLPENYQTVIRLRNWEDLSFDEIGMRMDMSTSGVAKLWYRALVEIQKLYQQQDESRIS